MLNFIMPSVVMLSVIMLNVVTLNVVAQFVALSLEISNYIIPFHFCIKIKVFVQYSLFSNSQAATAILAYHLLNSVTYHWNRLTRFINNHKNIYKTLQASYYLLCHVYITQIPTNLHVQYYKTFLFIYNLYLDANNLVRFTLTHKSILVKYLHIKTS